jgi:FkbM family methyltransferase
VSKNLGLSLKEKIFLLVARMPGKWSKFCPSYLREYSYTVNKIISLGGTIDYEHRVVLVNFQEAQFKLRLGSTDFLVFDQVILEEEYAPVIKLIKENTDQLNGFNIIDAGANVGFASLYFSKSFPRSTIISIEPDRSNFNALQCNIEKNKLTQCVFPLNGGIWGKTCKLNLANSFRDGREWSLNLEETKANEQGMIDAFSLEDLMKKYTFATIDFLKIDIEGGEKNLFDYWSIDHSVLKRVKFLAIEIHDEMADRSQITSVLKQSGFTLTEINETTVGVNMDFVGGKRT